MINDSTRKLVSCYLPIGSFILLYLSCDEQTFDLRTALVTATSYQQDRRHDSLIVGILRRLLHRERTLHACMPFLLELKIAFVGGF